MKISKRCGFFWSRGPDDYRKNDRKRAVVWPWLVLELSTVLALTQLGIRQSDWRRAGIRSTNLHIVVELYTNRYLLPPLRIATYPYNLPYASSTVRHCFCPNWSLLLMLISVVAPQHGKYTLTQLRRVYLTIPLHHSVHYQTNTGLKEKLSWMKIYYLKWFIENYTVIWPLLLPRMPITIIIYRNTHDLSKQSATKSHDDRRSSINNQACFAVPFAAYFLCNKPIYKISAPLLVSSLPWALRKHSSI